MARPLRILYPGAWYHVMNRDAGRRVIFRNPNHYKIFLSLLGDLHETFGIETHAYCLMPSHYHWLVRSARGNLDRAMRHLNGLYTQRYNRREQIDGPLFRGKYKALLVDADSNMAQVSHYIHLNPVEDKRTSRPDGYPWSSYGACIGKREAPDWLYRDFTLGLFGARGARGRYRAFVESGMDDQMRAFYAKRKFLPILGGRDFHAKVTRRFSNVRSSGEVPETRKIGPSPSMEEIIRITADEFGVSKQNHFRSIRGRGKGNLPRTVAVGLCRRLTGASLQEIADRFTMGHYSSVTASVHRLGARVEEDPGLAKRVAMIRDRLGWEENV